MNDKANPAKPEKTESKREGFLRLANKRTNNALGQIKLIGNLASANYEYTSEDGEKIVAAIRAAADKVEKAFKGEKSKDSGFAL